MKNLTEQQLKVLDFLKISTASGIPPSVREICKATGISSTSSVHSYLKALEEKGFISRFEGRNRSISVKGSENIFQVPILGTVTAGAPILAFEDIQGYIPFSNKSGYELFALKIKGLSMKEAGILDGDFVIARKTNTANNGEIVIALIEDEATVKTFYKENGHFRLQPENPNFDPIITEDVVILGVVIAQMRNY